MKRVVASYSAKSYNGRSWDELILQLDRAGYEVDSAYQDHPHKWIELIKYGQIFDAEVTAYHDGNYEVMEENIYLSNHNDLVDRVISQLGDIVNQLSDAALDDEQARDIMRYLMQVSENIQQYRSGKYE